LQTYVWQDYDLFPNFPALKDFLAFWEKSLEGPLFAVTVPHSKLIKPPTRTAVDVGVDCRCRGDLRPYWGALIHLIHASVGGAGRAAANALTAE